ncbi:hypothetical protein H0H93_005692 [Arthromyces matolae]|nr:hypothetical protein H0H93_005692 [Arthromyces matolae]
MLRFFALAALLVVNGVYGIGQDTCVTFQSSSTAVPIVSKNKAAPILISADDWPGVQRAAADFASDIQKVTGVQPSLTNVTSSTASKNLKSTTPIIVGTLGKSSLIAAVVNATNLDVSSIQGQWESFIAREVKNPLPGIDSAYVIIGSDKRGTVFALYDHSEQFGEWADVPVTKHSELYVSASGCSHGEPTVKYRGIFLNDEQPALQNWAIEKFTNGSLSDMGPFGSPFNHFFYVHVFELILRLKGNYLWPGMCLLHTLDNFDTFGNRYVDVGSGGPSTFTFTVTSNASWVQLSETHGTVSPSNPESRVFISVKDWSKLPVGTSQATLTFTATAKGQLPLVVPVYFNATRNELPSSFKGFVEGAGVISMEAAHVARNTSVSGVYWKTLPRYGRTLSALTTWPHLGDNEGNFTVGAGPSVEYDFYNFNTIGESGNLTVTTFVNPSFNAGEKDRPIGFAVQLDSQAPQPLYFFPPATPGGYPAAWGGNDGFAANNIISVVASFTGVSAGAHTLKIEMIEPSVVVEKIVINAGGLLPSYLGPPESIRFYG